MKKIICCLLLLIAFSGIAQKRIVKYQVLQIVPYCGGARPTAEMEKEAQTPRPYANKTLIYKPKKGAVDSVKTDEQGIFTAHLKPGTYKFYEPWKYYKKSQDGSPLNHFDKKCLEAEWKKEDLLMVADKTNEKVTNNIHQGKCQWQYPCYLKEYTPRLPE